MRWGILPLFLVSGATGLVYEVTWGRAFGVVFGNTVFAVSTVLTAFMFGLAAGSYLLGKAADRSLNPARLYAGLQLAVGVYAFFFPTILQQTDALYSWVYHNYEPSFFQLSLLRLLVSIVILLVPTVLMGGTLPTVSRLWAEPADRHPRNAGTGRSVGMLYALNTFGAVAGSFLCGYFLIRFLGVSRTIYSAAAVNVCVAVTAFVLSCCVSSPTPGRRRTTNNRPDAAENDRASSRRTRHLLLGAMMLAGFCALALEVLWTRVLVFVLGTSVYAFSCMLTTFILGIALGSTISSRLIVSRLKRPARALGFVELLLGCTVFSSIFLLEYLWHIDLRLTRTLGEPLTFAGDTIRHFLDAGAVLLGPTILMGIAFPIAVKICAPRWDTVAKRVGQLYACNTIGCVAGSFAAGFLLIPLIGLRNSFMLVITVQLFLGVVVLLLLSEARRVATGVIAAVVSVLIVVVGFGQIPADVFLRTIKTYHHPSEVLFMKDGSTGTVTVHDIPDGDRVIAVDGVNVAGIDLMLRTTQKLQAYAPLFVHGSAKKVLQIGFGSGETCGIGLDFDKSADYEYTICEICPEVFEAGRYFEHINRGCYKNPRLRKVIMDGKNFVKLTDQKFDIIMNDSTYPGTTGSSALYTYDHFKACREHLRPGGVLSCWVPLDLRPEDFAVIVRSFQAVMPNCSLWMANNCLNKHAVILGTAGPMEIRLERLRELTDRPDTKEDLEQINIFSLYDFLDCLLVGEDGLRAIGGEGPLNTDDVPVLEFGASIRRDSQGCWLTVLEAIVENHTPPAKYTVGAGIAGQDGLSAQDTLEKYYRGTGHALRGLIAILRGNADILQQAFERARRINPQDRDIQSCIDEIHREIAAFEQAVARLPRNAMLRQRLAKRYMLLTDYPRAAEQYELYVELCSEDPAAQARGLNNLGVCYRRMGQTKNAIDVFEKAIELAPGLVESYMGLAAIYKDAGDIDKAIAILNRAIKVSDTTGRVSIYTTLSRTHWERGDYRSALEYLDSALELLPQQSAVRRFLSERRALILKAIEAQGPQNQPPGPG